MLSQNQKKSIYIIFGLGAIIGLFGFLRNRPVKIQNSVPPPLSVKEERTVDIVPVDKDKLPDKFPLDIPLEKNAEITYNFNTVNLDNKFQASREFISKKSLEENYKLYQKVLTDNGWEINQALDDGDNNQKIILAKKGENELNIRIYSDASGVKVAISNETEP